MNEEKGKWLKEKEIFLCDDDYQNPMHLAFINDQPDVRVMLRRAGFLKHSEFAHHSDSDVSSDGDANSDQLQQSIFHTNPFDDKKLSKLRSDTIRKMKLKKKK